MAADWNEVARISVSSTGTPGGGLHPPTAVIFDDVQELIWFGNAEGRLVSYHGAGLDRYTSVRAHLNEGPVKQLLSHEKGVISISSRSVHLVSRKAPSIWHLGDPTMTDLRCMSFTHNPNHIFVAGCQATFYIVDVEKGVAVSREHARAHYTIAKKSRHICAATNDGKVHVLSASDYSLLKIFEAHSSAVSDMDTHNDYLVTVGLTLRPLGLATIDQLIRVFDLKNLTSLGPCQFPSGGSFVRLHPKLQTTSIVASQTGQLMLADIMNEANTATVHRHANVQFMLGLEISPSGDALIVVDSSGFICLWTTPGKSRFNSMSKETEFGSANESTPPQVDWHESPLNSVGLPYYTNRLLSAWPSQMVFDVGAPPFVPDTAFVPHPQPAEMGVYGVNPNRGKVHRYQAENARGSHTMSSIAAPKFLSEKAKETVREEDIQQLTSTVDALAGVNLNGHAHTEEEMMLKYNKVEIKYSRFGIDDFDFSYFNKTSFSGLETHISNSFMNSILQLYKFVPVIRNIAIQHAATSCVIGTCMLCEFGFLFDMLEKAAGKNCQATNLLRAFGASREAANLGLFEKPALAAGTPLTGVIQSANRFFLDQMTKNYKSMTGSTEGIDQALSTEAYQAIRCDGCSTLTSQHAKVYVHDIVYPQIDPKHYRPHAYPFSSILRTTIEKEIKNRGFCDRCRRYQPLTIRKTVTRLPYALVLNTALTNPSARAIWETPGWLPQEIGLRVTESGIQCFQGQDLSLHLHNNSAGIMVYELVGFVADIDTDDKQQPHLVSMINVNVSTDAPLSHPTQPTSKDWHLFNDFLVSEVSPTEALKFNKAWKLPSILCYQVKSAHGRTDDSWKHTLDTHLLFQEYSINGQPSTEECRVLHSDEIPGEGTPIALDTEFVDLEKAEIDIKANGTAETIRPAKSGLARVSVLRGDGHAEGSPFIDDYITVNEPIVDYKTQYSGIRPGDLDAHISPHNLVPLKVAYKKLWLLLNLGCTFVGHGLASDFRKANIHVPKAQTVDTQYLYLAHGKHRRLSLKYLAWAVFKELIQEEALDENHVDGHNSIEDARMALRLWRKFQEYEENGIVEQMVEEIYRKGTRYGWKPPLRSGGGLMPEGTATGGNSAFASGRNTPEPAMPGTPSRRPAGTSKLGVAGIEAFVPGDSVVRESPLR